VTRRRALHPGVAPPASAAEKYRLLDSKRVQCRGQLAYAVPAKLVGLIDCKVCPALADHLTLLAEGARHDVDTRAAGDVVRDGRAGRQGFVVRMGMDEQQSGGLHSDQLARLLA
jgi:hypothetical protein